jgi:uncharacterized membrane protein
MSAHPPRDDIPGSQEGWRQPPPKILQPGIMGRLRAYFIAGILVMAPISITFYVAFLVITFVDNRVSAFIPRAYHPDQYLPFSIPGLGIVVVVVLLTLIGWLTAGYIGRFFVRVSGRILANMPVIRSLYAAIKQIFETVLAHSSSAFRQVVLIEYPRRGMWAMAFITGVTRGEVQNLTADEVINVFLPTTPNPTSGFLLFVPRRDVILLDMTVEEGLKMIISGGIVTPPDRRPPDARRLPEVPARAAPPAETAETVGREPEVGEPLAEKRG